MKISLSKIPLILASLIITLICINIANAEIVNLSKIHSQSSSYILLFGVKDIYIKLNSHKSIKNNYLFQKEINFPDQKKLIMLAGKICGDTYYSDDMYAECPRELVDPERNYPEGKLNHGQINNDDSWNSYQNAQDRTQRDIQNMANNTNDYEKRINGTLNTNTPTNSDGWQTYQDAQSRNLGILRDMAK